MVVILGESASGKSTLQKMFIEAVPGYKKIVTYTTRPMREGEIDGVDYHFVEQHIFDKCVATGFFVEYAKYRNWDYGMAKSDCITENTIAILTPAGLRTLNRNNINVISVYLHVDRRSRLIKILSRGDNIDEAYRRNLSDVGQFDRISDEVDYVIDNERFQMNEGEVLAKLIKILQDRQKERGRHENI